MKSEKILTIVTSLIWGFLLAVEALTTVVILKLDMLPLKYILLLIAIFLLIWAGLGAMLFVKGKKRKISSGRRIAALLLTILVAAGCAGLSSVIDDVQNTVSTITNAGDITTVMAVYVLNENPAQTIEDAADYNFGMMDEYEPEKAAQAVYLLEQLLNVELTTTPCASVVELVEGLYNGDVDAVIMSTAYAAMLEDNDVFADFPEKVRVLYEIALTEADVPKETESTEATADETEIPETTDAPAGDDRIADITNTPFLVYLSGSDTRSTMLTTSRSDVNILVAVNPETKQILLVNTPRDYYIPNPAMKNRLDKLTHCGNSGVDCSMEALENLYGQSIDYYAQINFAGFETMVDAVGGITVYSDVGFNALGTYYIQKGENYLNGAQALAFARDRYHLADGDNARGRNQMKVITAVIDKMTSSTMITNYSSILESLEGMFVTDLSSENISKLVKMQLSDMAEWNVQSYAVTGVTGSDITASMPGVYLSVMYCDDDMVAFGSELIQRVFDGEILTEDDVVYTK